MTDREVMQQALEALRSSTDYRSGSAIQVEAVENLCEALEQPEQEPMRMPKVGDKVICLEDESIGTIVSLTAGGSPDIAFNDGSRGTYFLREFAELFGYVTPPAAQPQQVDCPRCGHVCSQRPWQGLTDEDVNKESAMIASKMKLAFHAGMYVAQKILKERNI
jgi:hypothetical protein